MKTFYLGPINDIIEHNNSIDKNKLSKEDWFRHILDRLQAFQSEKYLSLIIYKFGSDILFEQQSGIYNNNLWCHYDKIWSVLINKYRLKHNDVQYFIKKMMEECFKLRRITPMTCR
jgi:hypothetical protein